MPYVRSQKVSTLNTPTFSNTLLYRTIPRVSNRTNAHSVRMLLRAITKRYCRCKKEGKIRKYNLIEVDLRHKLFNKQTVCHAAMRVFLMCSRKTFLSSNKFTSINVFSNKFHNNIGILTNGSVIVRTGLIENPLESKLLLIIGFKFTLKANVF